MINTLHVVPAKGRRVPDPERGGFLLPEGRKVQKNQYWMRRLSDGDVERKMQPKQVAKTKLNKES